MTLIDFLLARIAEEEQKMLAFFEAQRRAIVLHESWPVLAETPPYVETGPGPWLHDGMAFRVAQQVAWLTHREYLEKFGTEPPTTAILRALAAPYRGHPDYREEWS